MSSSLKNKAVKGVAWSFVDNIANSGITFLVGLVLARLLSPAEYGIMAMIAIFIAVSNSIIDSGFSNALIRKIEIKQIDYNTVFFFNLFVSFILYILLYAISPAISNFFQGTCFGRSDAGYWMGAYNKCFSNYSTDYFY